MGYEMKEEKDRKSKAGKTLSSRVSLLEYGRELMTRGDSFQGDKSKDQTKRSSMITVSQSSPTQERPRASSMIITSPHSSLNSTRYLLTKSNYQRRSSCDCARSRNSGTGNYEKMKNANISSTFFKSNAARKEIAHIATQRSMSMKPAMDRVMIDLQAELCNPRCA